MNSAEEILAKQISDHKTPGVQYLYFNQDSVLFSYQGGLSDISNKKKVTRETTFNGYSVTKTFTGLAILQLAEKGLLDIDHSASEYLENFPYPGNITVRQLLTHTAGIPNPMPMKWIHTMDEHHALNYREYFENIFKKHNKTKSSPNEKFAYTNLGYILLGMIIEEVSGQSYTDYVNENIIRKAGIKTEELAFTIQNTNLHAKSYQKRLSFTNLILGALVDKAKFTCKPEGRWLAFRNHYVNGVSYGGLIGNAGGFSKYIQELLKPGNVLLTDEYRELLFTENKTKDGKPTGMCMSWFKGKMNGHTYYAHAGGGIYYCEIRIYPELGTGSVVMFNRSGMTDERFLDRIDRYFTDQK